jgi:hypothetical protein
MNIDLRSLRKWKKLLENNANVLSYQTLTRSKSAKDGVFGMIAACFKT